MNNVDSMLRRLLIAIKQHLETPAKGKIDDDRLAKWERSRTIAAWVSAAAVPLVLGVSGYYVNLNMKTTETSSAQKIKSLELNSARTLKEIDTNSAMISLAIAILKEDPQGSEDNRLIRSWAVDVINRYSDVKMPPETKKAVISKEPLVGRRLNRPDPAEYQRLYVAMDLMPEKVEKVREITAQIRKSKKHYQAVEKLTGVPWPVVAAIHWAERRGDFGGHFHNGDSLTACTVHIPKGRPKEGTPPFTWEQSAADAIRLRGLDKVSTWTIEEALYQIENYNGMGYRMHHPDVLSPYLWAGTNNYKKGGYRSDGQWSDDVLTDSIGAAAILKFAIPETNFIGQDASKN